MTNRRGFFSAACGAVAFLDGAVQRARAAAATRSGRGSSEVAADEDYWSEVRHAFSIDRNVINLNNASVCPAPKVVKEAMYRYLEIMNMQPSYYVDELLIPHSEGLRRRLAAAFGCDAEEIAITRNATEALEILQMGLDLKAGDEVLTTTQDYPKTLTAWRMREQRHGIVLKTMAFPTPPPSLDDLYERFASAISPRTRVILLCHMTYTTGQIFPVKKICRMARERGIETIVDGAQTFGHLPFVRDDLDCDYYATSLHKWLLAPVGTGFLYVRKPRISNIWPLFSSPAPRSSDIRKFEGIGTFPVAARNAISEALAFQDTIGLDRKAARLRYLREGWCRRLEKLPGVRILTSFDPAQSCGMGAFRIDGIDCDALTEYLMKKYQVHVRARHVKGEFSAIRVTPNVYTTLEEIGVFCSAIEDTVRQGKLA
ncbi:MAG: aminotransferase class V-fold PLP-dependent enzyme [Acidobacteria bacterium]|nr:aminotransferase class V-fold PLP-dependent enzyme [Acidobacteriota bacterium]